MITKITTVDDFQSIFIEMMLNRTDKVTKVSDGSVLKGIAFGNSKNAQKINKDVAILESQLFPEMGTGNKLDDYGRLNGLGERFGQKYSSTYILLVADIGTIYLKDLHTFSSINGVEFTLDKDIVIGDFGWTYAKIRSTTKGLNANSDALTINTVNPQPDGHKYCINEYAAQYGSDYEEDDVFRKRLSTSANILSKSTLGMFEQVFMKINENVLRVYFNGLNSEGKIVLSILTQNGINLTDQELNDILIRGEKYFSLLELRPVGVRGFGIVLQNVEFQPIDISMRVEIESSYIADDVRKEMQISMNKYIDYRYFDIGSKIEWDNLLQIAKTTEGIRYVSDSFFYPNSDIDVNIYKLPRIRGFQMLDINGKILSDVQGLLNPVFYPNQIDFIYQSIVLQSI